MRREIKFRAWKRPTKTLAYGVYPHGSYVCFPNSLPLPEDKQTPYSGDKQDGYFEARKCELMQFTGLHDKNGKEIYEGDIVTTNYPTVKNMADAWVVEFGHTGMYQMAVGSFKQSIHELVYNDWKLEVIGNIHENPELLGVK